jgi:hypothetical protein
MRCWAAALLACCLACGRPGSAPPPAALVPWLRSDPQRCLLSRDLSEGMETMARHCAEAFVRENGYTELPAEDSTRWTREAGDDGPWVRVLAARNGTLDPRAETVQCSRRECVALFRMRRPMLLCGYRAVTMTQVFTRIRLAPGGIRDARCNERRA